MALATAKQINEKYLKDWDVTTYIHHAGQLQNLCPDEPFTGMRTLGGCSGFLIDHDVLVTAGHCSLYAENQCKGESWLFNHFSNKVESNQYHLQKSNLYRCVQVLDYRHDQVADYAVLRLDRPVPNAIPFQPNMNNQIQYNDSLAVLGYPLGLSFYYTPGGSVQSMNDNTLLTDLDVYDKNSGSLVLNLRTGKAEGIVTNGVAGLTINPIDGCLETKSHQSTLTYVNRLNQIPYLQNHYASQTNVSEFQVINNCTQKVRIVGKFRSLTNNSLTTKMTNMEPGSIVQFQSSTGNLYLHAKTEPGVVLVQGKDFYGFVDKSHNEEIGFLKFTNTNIYLCE